MTELTHKFHPATGRQVEYIRVLMQEAGLNEAEANKANTELEEGLSKDVASRWIDRLVNRRTEHARKQRQRERIENNEGPEGFADIPQGHYAITGRDGTTDFYQVQRPTKGKWAGYTFVKLQLSDEYKRLSIKMQKSISHKIEDEGPEKASKRYGKEIGRCGICNRTLTNPDSIAKGIGPVCAGQIGWRF